MTEMPGASPVPGVPEGSPPRRLIWPTVIGITSIVLGGFRLTCTPISLFCVPGFNEMLVYLPYWWAAYGKLMACVEALLAFWLVAAGIVLLGRRREGRPLLLGYGLCEIFLCIVDVALTALCLDTQARYSLARTQLFFWAAVATPLATGYPLFLVIWFLRPKIREQVAAWGR
jgi:hypothetical protein